MKIIRETALYNENAVDGVQKAIDETNETIYGADDYYQYTYNGVSYPVWYDGSTDKYYYDYNGTATEVLEEDLDRYLNGDLITIPREGLQQKFEKLSSAIVVDEDEPSITLMAEYGDDDQRPTKVAKQKLTASQWQLIKINNDVETIVAYVDADEDEGIIDIDNARIHDSIYIGNLEIFNNNGNIGVRRI